MILIEENFNGVDTLVESVDGQKKSYLSGLFMEAETRNQNGRIYKTSDIQKSVDKINESARLNRFILSELDHPSTLEIKLENVAMKIVEAKMVGSQAICKAEVLHLHPKGAILQSLIDSGIQVGVSSRGTGQVNESTGVVSNFNFVTVDAVATPSCRNAYPMTIREHLEMYKRGGVIDDLAEAVINDKKAQDHFQKEMLKWIQSTFA